MRFPHCHQQVQPDPADAVATLSRTGPTREWPNNRGGCCKKLGLLHQWLLHAHRRESPHPVLRPKLSSDGWVITMPPSAEGRRRRWHRGPPLFFLLFFFKQRLFVVGGTVVYLSFELFFFTISMRFLRYKRDFVFLKDKQGDGSESWVPHPRVKAKGAVCSDADPNLSAPEGPTHLPTRAALAQLCFRS